MMSEHEMEPTKQRGKLEIRSVEHAVCPVTKSTIKCYNL